MTRNKLFKLAAVCLLCLGIIAGAVLLVQWLAA